jgi:hypothetical protein
MPAINIELTEGELQFIRDQAKANDLSMRAWSRHVLLGTYADDEAAVDEGIAVITAWSAELNRRLA